MRLLKAADVDTSVHRLAKHYMMGFPSFRSSMQQEHGRHSAVIPPHSALFLSFTAMRKRTGGAVNEDQVGGVGRRLNEASKRRIAYLTV